MASANYIYAYGVCVMPRLMRKYAMARSDYSHVKRYLEVWFEETGPKHWYKKSDAFDADIRRRFETIAIDVATDGSAWEVSPDSHLALIIILDQFSRNMYRETKAAFAWDG